MLVWTCPYCGNQDGVYFRDRNLEGMLCADPECGRFYPLKADEKLAASHNDIHLLM